MKINYKGFELDVHRDQCLGGWSMLYFSIFTPSGYELLSSFEDSEEKVRDKIKQLKEVVDDYLINPRNWVDEDEDV
ncbi:hypothetical protein D3C74_365340 [compost metagenome]